MAGASAIWFVPTLGRVLGWLDPHFRPTDWIGTWAMYAGTAVAFAGGVVAVVELRTTNDEAETTSSGVVGFILGVLGVVVYGVSTTLAYYSSTSPGLPPGAAVSFSLFSELKRQSVVLTIALAILVYGVPAVLAVISFGGIRGLRAGLWAMALLAGALAWSPKLALLADYSRYSRGFWGVEIPHRDPAGGRHARGHGHASTEHLIDGRRPARVRTQLARVVADFSAVLERSSTLPALG